MFRTILPIATALSVTAVLFQMGFTNLALAIAEPLIPINTGNANLDNNIPKFFSCIKKAVKQNVDVQDSYFKHEPTKDEVVKCYHDVIASSSSGNSNSDGANSNDVDSEKINKGR
jgi:hypothetical protein